MARGIAAGAVVGAAVAACFSTPSRPNGAPDDGRLGDGRKIDSPGDGVLADSTGADARPGCTIENFSVNGPDCGTFWDEVILGSGGGNGTISRGSGQLYVSVSGSGSVTAGCRRIATQISELTFDVTSVLATASGETTFVGFYDGSGSAYGVQLSHEFNGSYIGMRGQCSNSTVASPLPQWDSTNHKFVRVFKDIANAQAKVVAGPTPTNLNTTLATCSGTTQFNTAEIAFIVTKSAGSGSGTVGSAAIESLEFCPP
jgi:hypothetical protein